MSYTYNLIPILIETLRLMPLFAFVRTLWTVRGHNTVSHFSSVGRLLNLARRADCSAWWRKSSLAFIHITAKHKIATCGRNLMPKSRQRVCRVGFLAAKWLAV